MKILFDQGTPVPLRKYLAEHSVDTTFEQSWSDLKNGELLNKAEKNGYQLLITTDQNLRYQRIFRAENSLSSFLCLPHGHASS